MARPRHPILGHAGSPFWGIWGGPRAGTEALLSNSFAISPLAEGARATTDLVFCAAPDACRWARMGIRFPPFAPFVCNACELSYCWCNGHYDEAPGLCDDCWLRLVGPWADGDGR